MIIHFSVYQQNNNNNSKQKLIKQEEKEKWQNCFIFFLLFLVPRYAIWQIWRIVWVLDMEEKLSKRWSALKVNVENNIKLLHVWIFEWLIHSFSFSVVCDWGWRDIKKLMCIFKPQFTRPGWEAYHFTSVCMVSLFIFFYIGLPLLQNIF